MKVIKVVNLLALGVALTFVVSGCRKRPGTVTPLPPGRVGVPPGPDQASRLDQDQRVTDGSIPTVSDSSMYDNWPQDREIFSAYTVYFDFDSTTVKASEKSKIEAVADYFKKNSGHALKIEGHCDERGTEEYNRSLGERRALALRENLARLGVDPQHIVTISFGEDKPAVEGQDEAAWSKNRRGVFILLTPP